jgi:hypothetical protein
VTGEIEPWVAGEIEPWVAGGTKSGVAVEGMVVEIKPGVTVRLQRLI